MHAPIAEVQDRLRLACDAILNEYEEEIITFYQESKEKDTSAHEVFCSGTQPAF